MFTPRLAATILCIAATSVAHAQQQTLRAVPTLTFAQHSGESRELAFSPDGRLLATSSLDSTIRLWSLPTGALLRKIPLPSAPTSIEFSRDGRWLVSGGYDGMVRIWELPGGTVARTLAGHTGTVWSVAFAPDGKTVASSGEDKTVKVWRTADGALLHTLRGHARNVWHVAFSPDGRHIASGSFDKVAKLWRADTGALEHNLVGSGEAIVSLAFSPDGRLLATGGDDSSVRLWRVSDGHLMKTIPAYNHVFSVAFSPDGQWLATGGRARSAVGTFWHQLVGDRFSGANPTSVRLWRVSDGALLQSLNGHSDDVISVAFSPDGKLLATGSEDHTMRLWRLVTRAVK